MTSCYLGALGFTLMGALTMVHATQCQGVLSVDQAIQRARRLDGTVVCVKGWIHSIPIDKSAVLVWDLVPVGVGAKQRWQKRSIGLVEWSSAAGIDQEMYQPDSYMKLDAVWGWPPNSTVIVEVVYRGILKHKKYLLHKTILGHSFTAEERVALASALRHTRYDVELVTLEVVSAEGASAR